MRRSTREPRQGLLEEVRVAERERRQAERYYKETLRRAKAAGMAVEVEDAPANPDFKVRRNHIHIFPLGLENPDHGHLVIALAGELSPACIAELQSKVTNGKVTLDRDIRIGHRWCVEYHDQLGEMAAD